jgi:D-serine deaminase-like pyridoxal phosphate-dependent protein
VGQRIEEVDTPALVLDLDAFEHNLETLKRSVAGKVRVRAHAKTHKSPDIARRQIAAGAVGVCCQKVSEAEALVEGGVQDVLVKRRIVGAPPRSRASPRPGARISGVRRQTSTTCARSPPAARARHLYRGSEVGMGRWHRARRARARAGT